jgi:hypothetical protein
LSGTYVFSVLSKSCTLAHLFFHTC